MIIDHLIFWVFFAVTFGLFFWGLWRALRIIRLGKPEEKKRMDGLAERIKALVVYVVGQKRMFKDPYAGLLHALIFWGFCIHMVTTSEMIFRGFFDFTFHYTSIPVIGFIFYPIVFAEEVFAVVVIAAVTLALLRHLVARPERYSKEPAAVWDKYFILGFILVHMVLLSLMWGAEVRMGLLSIDKGIENFLYRPFSLALSFLFPGMTSMLTWYALWWVHLVVLFTFIVYITPLSKLLLNLGVSKHIHVVYAITNVFFRQLPSKTNKLNKLEIDLEAEDVESFGIDKVEDFTWRQLMDHYACLNCGRCTEQCPANLTDKKLSPRDIIVNIRSHLIEKGPILLKQKSGGNGKNENENAETEKKTEEAEVPAVMEAKLIGDVVTAQELWACTTCGACVEACPVFVEHLQKIVDMRRYLALTEMEFPGQEAENLFRSLENNFNPYGQGFANRFDWASDRDDVPLVKDKKDAEYLYFVGCAGSFDPRAIKVTHAVCDIFKQAGVSYAVLGTEEQNDGDTARKLGNEYLAQMLIEANVEKFKEYGVKKIIVHDPHAYNTIKKEYADYGLEGVEVIHVHDFTLDLIKKGKVKISGSLDKTVSYHDPCYLGRYNSMYDQARKLLRKVGSVKMAEPERTRETSFCCGGGGGWNFLEETEGKRINVERTEQVLDKKPDVIAVACPFCLAMFEDGLKIKDADEKVKVMDVMEIVAAAMDRGQAPAEEKKPEDKKEEPENKEEASEEKPDEKKEDKPEDKKDEPEKKEESSEDKSEEKKEDGKPEDKEEKKDDPGKEEDKKDEDK